jgi:hypothetical protein
MNFKAYDAVNQSRNGKGKNKKYRNEFEMAERKINDRKNRYQVEEEEEESQSHD